MGLACPADVGKMVKDWSGRWTIRCCTMTKAVITLVFIAMLLQETMGEPLVEEEMERMRIALQAEDSRTPTITRDQHNNGRLKGRSDGGFHDPDAQAPSFLECKYERVAKTLIRTVHKNVDSVKLHDSERTYLLHILAESRHHPSQKVEDAIISVLSR